MAYDTKKDTKGADVRKEAGEALEAVKALAGDGTVKAAAEEVKDVAVAAADFVADEARAAVRWFRSKLGYQLTDPTQGVNDAPITHEATPVVATEWVKEQAAKGWIEEVGPPAKDGK